MSKKLKKKRKSKQSKAPLVKNERRKSSNLHELTYNITYDPIEDENFKKLPEDVKDLINLLYVNVQQKPKQTIPKILEVIQRYPEIPALYNYLSIAYSLILDYEKADQVVLDNYQRNPSYLFARLNYAEILLNKGELDKVADVFDNKFDLKLLYPKRKVFHISEVVNFFEIVGTYFSKIGKEDSARLCLALLLELEPNHPCTNRLKKMLPPLSTLIA